MEVLGKSINRVDKPKEAVLEARAALQEADKLGDAGGGEGDGGTTRSPKLKVAGCGSNGETASPTDICASTTGSGIQFSIAFEKALKDMRLQPGHPTNTEEQDIDEQRIP